VGELDGRVAAWGRGVMRQAMASAWAAQAACQPIGPSPTRGEAESHPTGSNARRVETVFGPVTLSRQRRRCGGCGLHFQPDDALLVAEVGVGRLSPASRDLTALCCVRWPYRQAAEALGRLRGASLSAETVRAVVGTVGHAVTTVRTQDAAAAVAPPATAPAVQPAPERLEVELDRAWVYSHDTPHGLEIKVGGQA
jgi:hypothetical protein